MPTSKVCGRCAACGVDFKQGDSAVFFGHVRVVKDKLEPGGVNCIHKPDTACNVSHLHHEERCVVCDQCWANIKLGYLRGDIDSKDCTSHCEKEYAPVGGVT